MKKIMEYVWLEFKVQLRIPIALFFTICFPIMLLMVFVISTGNEVVYDNIHFVDLYLPVMMLLALFSGGIISFSVIVAGNRSEKVWQIYRLRGFKLYQIVLAQLTVSIFVSFISVILLIIVAKAIFNANIPEPKVFISFLGVWIIIALAIFLIGFVLGVFCKNEKVAQAVSTPIMFVLMFLSGIMINETVFPTTVQRLLVFLPTNQANKILVKNWTLLSGNGADIHWSIIIIWIIIASTIVIWKLYRDDFRRI